MAKEKKIKEKNGKYYLGGSKETDLIGVDKSKYDVITTDKNLAEAKSKYPNYDWFTCFTIKDKSGKQMGKMPAYTIKFNKLPSGKNLYYYYNGTAHQLSFSETEKKGNKRRFKATLTIGDPPIGNG